MDGFGVPLRSEFGMSSSSMAAAIALRGCWYVLVRRDSKYMSNDRTRTGAMVKKMTTMAVVALSERRMLAGTGMRIE